MVEVDNIGLEKGKMDSIQVFEVEFVGVIVFKLNSFVIPLLSLTFIYSILLT